ncbi:hypothetical protein EAF00_009244 [Botryotinia globosa]|nr:hypothetical protein EAF00_009244 [Botryotinia globosa]
MHLGPTSTCRSNPLNVLPCNLISFLHNLTQPVRDFTLSYQRREHMRSTYASASMDTYDFPTSILTKKFGDADPLFSQDWTY